MASSSTVLQGLLAQIKTVLPGSPVCNAGVGWPPINALQSVPKTGTSIGGVFDRGSPRNRSRWPRTTVGAKDVNVTVGISAALALPSLKKTGTTTITLSGTPKANDAVGLTVGSQPQIIGSAFQTSQGSSYVATPSDTLTTIAAGLAAAINANQTSVTASPAGAVVTLTGVLACTLAVATANQGTRITEYHRTERMVSFHLWAPSESAREQIGDPVDSFLGQLEATYGFQLSDNEWVHVSYDGDLYMEDDQLKDIYRRDFFTRLEYGTGTTDNIYPVVATQFQLSAGQG